MQKLMFAFDLVIGNVSHILWFSTILRFKTFGGRDPHRPAEDVAFSVARFFQKGGSVHNYYMVHFFNLLWL